MAVIVQQTGRGAYPHHSLIIESDAGNFVGDGNFYMCQWSIYVGFNNGRYSYGNE